MFQVSLRSLLVFVALCALAIVSLRFASPAWRTLVLGIDFVVVWAAAIVALVDRGERQAFAIGVVLSFAIYGAAVMWGRLEFNPAMGRLPTTRLLNPIYRAVAEMRWVDIQTGQEVPGYDPNAEGSAPGSENISLSEMPRRSIFMAIGHSWWALLLGFCGGWLARIVYLRRVSRPEQ